MDLWGYGRKDNGRGNRRDGRVAVRFKVNANPVNALVKRGTDDRQ